MSYVPTMNRKQAAQSLANEYGWGKVIGTRTEPGEGEVTLFFKHGVRVKLGGLLAWDILRRPNVIDRSKNPTLFAPMAK